MAPDCGSGQVVRTVGLGWVPRQALVDERAGRVLVVNAQGDTVTEPDPWAWTPKPVRQRLAYACQYRSRTNAVNMLDANW